MRSKVYAIISIPVFALLYCFTAFGVLIVMILTWFNARSSIKILTQMWARTIFLMIGKKFSITGKEYISKESRYILVANHASLFDIVAIVSFYPEVSWFGHERLLKVPIFSRILKMTDYIPFREPTVKNTKLMLEQLVQKSRDQTVAIFPEGTRTLDGKINDFYKGFIYLLRTSDVGILPVTLNGFYNLKPKNRFYINFDSKLDIIIHKPIERDDLVYKTDNEIIESVKTVIESVYI